jgi:hypothetical protein
VGLPLSGLGSDELAFSLNTDKCPDHGVTANAPLGCYPLECTYIYIYLYIYIYMNNRYAHILTVYMFDVKFEILSVAIFDSCNN